MAYQVGNNPQATLLGIPLEVRHAILSHLADGAQDITIMVYPVVPAFNSHTPIFDLFPCDDEDLDQIVEVARGYVDFDPDQVTDLERFRYKGFGDTATVARVCKTLAEDAIFKLYGVMRFQFLCLEDLQTFFQVAPARYTSVIRHLKISLPLAPPVPPQAIPAGLGLVLEIDEAMHYLLDVLGEIPDVPDVKLVTYVLSEAWDDSDDDGEDKFVMVGEHKDAVECLKVTLRENGRDITIEHSVVIYEGVA